MRSSTALYEERLHIARIEIGHQLGQRKPVIKYQTQWILPPPIAYIQARMLSFVGNPAHKDGIAFGSQLMN